MLIMSHKSSNIHLSKQLSWLLRHGAEKEGLAIKPDGFILVADLLKHPRIGASYSIEKLHEIVSSDAKQRYTLRRNPVTGAEEIRANQGHSSAAVDDNACLERIQNIDQLPPAVVHGTYYRHWERIKNDGLKRMQRNHVHFAVLGSDNRAALSGFRGDCQILIYLDVAKVLADKLELFRSSNNVVLCAGVDGCIKTTYFQRVIDRRTGKPLTY